MCLNNIFRLTPVDLQIIGKAIVYIDRYYRERLSADQLSIEFNISKPKLQAGFQEMTGLTLHNYILKVRVEKAKQLLKETNDPVKSIASAMGFKRPSHFIFTFKEFTSQTPSEYRLRRIA
ncbi:MAG TPA: AraC family transcriptional regulator [Puia sp.]